MGHTLVNQRAGSGISHIVQPPPPPPMGSPMTSFIQQLTIIKLQEYHLTRFVCVSVGEDYLRSVLGRSRLLLGDKMHCTSSYQGVYTA